MLRLIFVILISFFAILIYCVCVYIYKLFLITIHVISTISHCKIYIMLSVGLCHVHCETNVVQTWNYYCYLFSKRSSCSLHLV